LRAQVPEQLTDESIAEVRRRHGGGGIEIADALEPGLRLRIGTEAARWSYRCAAIQQGSLRIPLGTWPEVGVADVRRLVARLKVSFDDSPAPDAVATSVGRLLERYQARRLSQLRKGKVMGRAICVALEPMKHREAATLTRREIGEIVDAMADRAPIHANRVLAYLKAFFGWAVGRGYLEINPAAGISKPSREVTRDRTPSLPEIREIWDAAGQLAYPFGPAIRLLVLTAARRDEVGGMCVDEISHAPGADDAVWTLPAARSKNGRAIRNPIVPSARQVLADALAARPDGVQLVFTTTGRTAISGWSRAKERLDGLILAQRKERGIETPMPPWRFHDLRRAFATAASDILLIDPVIADRCLNHVGASTTSVVSRIYSRNELFEQRRDALERWAALVMRTDEPEKEPGS
jgi:integrase